MLRALILKKPRQGEDGEGRVRGRKTHPSLSKTGKWNEGRKQLGKKLDNPAGRAPAAQP